MDLTRFSVMIWKRKWQPTPVLLPGKSHGWRSLVGYSPGGHEESAGLSKFTFTHWRRWNGNPLQCSCLESPRDRGTWWAAVYGVAQSRTRLKWLHRSSSSVWWSYHNIYKNGILEVYTWNECVICDLYLNKKMIKLN